MAASLQVKRIVGEIFFSLSLFLPRSGLQSLPSLLSFFPLMGPNFSARHTSLSPLQESKGKCSKNLFQWRNFYLEAQKSGETARCACVQSANCLCGKEIYIPTGWTFYLIFFAQRRKERMHFFLLPYPPTYYKLDAEGKKVFVTFFSSFQISALLITLAVYDILFLFCAFPVFCVQVRIMWTN